MSAKPTDPQSSDTDSRTGCAEELSEFQRGTIVGCHLSKKSVREISALLELPRATVNDVVVKWKRLGITPPLPRTPHKLSTKDIQELERIVRENQLSSLSELTTDTSASGKSVGPRTVHQEPKSIGSQTAAKRPKGTKRKAKPDLQPDNEKTSKMEETAASSKDGVCKKDQGHVGAQTEPTSKPKDQQPMDGEASTTS